ncbi:DNA-directed DNA polymerase [Tanacetum coccineum]
MKCPQHYLTEMQEVILFYNGLDIPTRQILDSRGDIPSKTVADAKVAIQEIAEYSQKWHNGTSKGRSTKTSDGVAAIQAQLNNLGRDIKKANEKVYAAQVGCKQCKGPHYTKDCPLKEDGKTLKEAYYTNNANPSYQERRQSMEDTLSKFMSESAKRHEENSNLIKEIRAMTDAAIRNQRASIKTLETQIRQMSKLIHTRYAILDLPNTPYPLDRTKKKRESMKQNSRKLMELHISITPYPKRKKTQEVSLYLALLIMFALIIPLLTVELADRTVKYPKGIAENVLVGIGKFTFPIDFIILDMPEDIKVPLILRRPFLSTTRSKIDVYKRKITLRVGEEKIIFKSVKPASSLNRRVYMLSKVIEEFKTRNEDLDTGMDDYPSYCDDDKKIHISYAHNLRFSCMIGFEFTHANFFPLLYVNVMSKKFHNSIMKDKMVYKGDNVVGAIINVPIFVGTFSVMTDFAVLEDMDAYSDEGMGDIIVGKPFL